MATKVYKAILCGILFVFVQLKVQAQEDFTWWNQRHNWDGFSPWVNYMVVSPAYFGPNALPVPEFRKGNLSGDFSLEQSVGYHFAKGDKTTNFFTRIYVPLCQGRVALEGWVVPVEYFKTDTAIRDFRAARTESGSGRAGGDIYFSTQVELLKDKKGFPDFSLELAFRTASGTRLRDARYTDASGYFMNVAAGKNMRKRERGLTGIRPFAMAGFYSYQTYDLQHPQNDALLYAAGCDFIFSKLSISPSWGGYAGYQKNGDQPMVFRAQLQYGSGAISVKLLYQYGIQDYPFQSVRAGIVYAIRKKG